MAEIDINQKAAVYMEIAESHTGTQEELGEKLVTAQNKFKEVSQSISGSVFDEIPRTEIKKDLPPEDCSRV